MQPHEYLEIVNHTLSNRAEEYDVEEERSMAAVVKAFNAISDNALTESEGWMFMICLKQVRLFTAKQFHKDSAIDLIAYGTLLAECMERDFPQE